MYDGSMHDGSMHDGSMHNANMQKGVMHNGQLCKHNAVRKLVVCRMVSCAYSNDTFDTNYTPYTFRLVCLWAVMITQPCLPRLKVGKVSNTWDN